MHTAMSSLSGASTNTFLNNFNAVSYSNNLKQTLPKSMRALTLSGSKDRAFS